MVLQAPVVLTFCADQYRIETWMKQNKAEYSNNNLICLFRAIIDVSLVAQNVALAAEALGLGTCYMGSTLMNPDKISNILDLPSNVFPVTSLVMGWPDESSSLVERLPLEAVVHSEQYQRFTEDKIDEFYKKRDEDSWSRLKTRKEIQEKVSSGEITNAPQIYSSLKFSKSAFENFSMTIAKVLAEKWNINVS